MLRRRATFSTAPMTGRHAKEELRALTGLRFVAAAAVVAFRASLRGGSPRSACSSSSRGSSSRTRTRGGRGRGATPTRANAPFDACAAVAAFYRARFARVYPVYVLGLAVGAVAAAARPTEGNSRDVARLTCTRHPPTRRRLSGQFSR